MPHTPSAGKRLRKSREAAEAEPRRGQEGQDAARKAIAEAIKAGDAAKTATEFKTTQAMLDRAADEGLHPPEQGRPAEVAAGEEARAAAAK